MAAGSDPTTDEYQYFLRWNRQRQGEEHALPDNAVRQRDVIDGWLAGIGRRDLDILEVGCGTGWLVPTLTPYGRVTGTDLIEESIDQARERHPDARFVAGDFASVDLPVDGYDVVVTVETLAHVADQPAFIAKISSLLRDQGHLLMATQNRIVLQHFNRLPPPSGQRRDWTDRQQLRALVAPHFEVLELRSVTPRSNRMPLRLVTSPKVNRAVGTVFGNRFVELQERLGLGWTLMLRAQKRAG
jgi:SAM-dependent methyltransferase